jgi:hypothetical protein
MKEFAMRNASPEAYSAIDSVIKKMLQFGIVKEQEAAVFIPACTLGIPRNKMPQVKSTDVPEFLEWLKQLGVTSRAEKVQVDQLCATQKEINKKKIAAMTAIAPEAALNKPVIVSKDDHIFDGHHRWLALLNRDPKFRMKAYRTSIPIRRLLTLASQFPKTTHKGIEEGKVKAAVEKAIEKLASTLHKDEEELWRELMAKPATFLSKYGQYITPLVSQLF